MSITIRAVGQAARRGATRRVPNAAALLDIVDEWLPEGASDTMRRRAAGDRTPDGAIEATFHPAARPITFEATDTGRLTVQAMTVPVGPGYHTYVASLLRRMGDELDIEWSPAADPNGGAPEPAPSEAPAEGRSMLSRATALSANVLARVPVPGSGSGSEPEEEIEPSSDPTGAFFSGSRADAERGHLGWLRSSLQAVRDARRQGATGIHLATPAGVRFTFDGAVATVLGPRDDAWLERALADPREATDILPWVADAMDARYHLNRALTQLWTEVRWRAPAGERETAVLDDVLATLRHAYPLEPTLAWPWREWREAFVLRGQTDPATFQMLQRANAQAGLRPPEPPPGKALIGGDAPAPAPVAPDMIGYRRLPVTIIHEGWAVDLPGSFSEERSAEEWSGSDPGRSVTLAATETATGGAPMSADTFLREFASSLGRDAIEHEAGPVRGRARLSSDSSTGVDVATVEGYSAIRGSGAVIRIVIEDPEDWKWALDTWRGLRPA